MQFNTTKAYVAILGWVAAYNSLQVILLPDKNNNLKKNLVVICKMGNPDPNLNQSVALSSTPRASLGLARMPRLHFNWIVNDRTFVKSFALINYFISWPQGTIFGNEVDKNKLFYMII